MWRTKTWLLAVALLWLLPSSADAHRSGCHRWHSCPSDSGSYTCGDTGYCSQCPDNRYCQGGRRRAMAQGTTTQTTPQRAAQSDTQETTEASQSDKKEIAYVGSARSDKYHHLWCRWAKKIKSYNLVGFSSPEEAQGAGYVPCKVCRPPIRSE